MPVPTRALRASSALLAVMALGHAVEQPLAVLEPKEAKPIAPRNPERARWSWNTQAATVSPTGELSWAPRPFAFVPGESQRFIDFEKGSDAAAGTSRETAWKHHPWDPAATGTAAAEKGAHTFVFKRGVVYRGTLRAQQTDGAVSLTSDPAWGSGEAVISGAERVTGWTKGSANPDIPEAGTVWTAEVPFLPRNLWLAGKTEHQRLKLARTPNWTESDPNFARSEWWTWEQPEWWTDKLKIDHNGGRAHLGIDTKNLTKDADYYVGAVVRTEFAILMSTPFPTRVEGYDAERKGIIFQGIWFGDSERIVTANRYYLEDKPHYLDQAGEFWIEQQGDGARIHLRLPDDSDPNQAVIEAAKHIDLVHADGMKDVTFSGLTFRHTNTHWDLVQPPWGHPDVDNAAIRVLGSVGQLTVANCTFEQVAKAVQVKAGDEGRTLGQVMIRDNDIRSLDHGALDIGAKSQGDVQILRNRLRDIGSRAHRQDWGHALCVYHPTTQEIAGNILERCYGAGIFLFGGQTGDPMARVLVHHNRAVDTLLAANDWGGIETWMGGPHYVYNNISGNPGGRWWADNGNARLGMAFYHDGAFKVHNFNNVAWGLSNDPKSPECAHAAYYQAVPTIENTFFNNTAYRFSVGTNWGPVGGRHASLGNLWIDICGSVFEYGKLKEENGPAPEKYDHATTAISRNVFSNITAPRIGIFEATGEPHADVASMRTALEKHKPLAADVGVVATGPVIRDGEKRDFRPVAGSAAIDQGVKVFIPWSIAATVGEWHFRRNNTDPTAIIDNAWTMTPYHVSRDTFYQVPTHPLTGVGITVTDYAAGPLEDWADGALTFDGTKHATLTHAEMTKPYTFTHKDESKTYAGADLVTPDIATSSLLIEAYLQTSKPGSVLVAKLAESGYQLAINRAGGVTLTLKGGGATAELASGAIITDGKWHHVLVEFDRKAGTGAIYVDGVVSAKGALALPADASLTNEADLLVGKGPNGNHFTGSLEFLRIARATLAESKTSIEELYDWQFDGPFLRDFAGKEITGKRRDAGAFEFQK